MRNYWMLGAVLALAGCGPVKIATSGVTPAGDGNYLVVAKPDDNTDWSDIQVQALKSADTYCTSRGQVMHQVKVETHGTSGWGQQEYALTFRCGP